MTPQDFSDDVCRGGCQDDVHPVGSGDFIWYGETAVASLKNPARRGIAIGSCRYHWDLSTEDGTLVRTADGSIFDLPNADLGIVRSATPAVQPEERGRAKP